jgi:hypothetical protein
MHKYSIYRRTTKFGGQRMKNMARMKILAAVKKLTATTSACTRTKGKITAAACLHARGKNGREKCARCMPACARLEF